MIIYWNNLFKLTLIMFKTAIMGNGLQEKILLS